MVVPLFFLSGAGFNSSGSFTSRGVGTKIIGSKALDFSAALLFFLPRGVAIL